MRDRRKNYTPPEASAEIPAMPEDDFAAETDVDAGAEPVAAFARVEERIVPAEFAGLRIDQALARMFPEHSRSRLQDWLADGHIRLDGGGAKPKQRIWGGERIAVETLPDRTDSAYTPEAIDIAIVYEDDAVIVIDKSAGLVVHPGSGNWSGTLANALLHHAPQLSEVPRAGVVHRLDKDTTGLMVVAKTLTAQTALVRQLQDRSVERLYLALVRGAVRGEGTVNAPVGRDPHSRTRMAVTDAGKEAITHYRAIEAFEGATLLECKLATGRTHQIRVHMASIGFPIAGDPVYRSALRARLPRAGERNVAVPEAIKEFPRQALHARRLAFIHPVSGERVGFDAPLPADFAALLATLREAV